MNAAFLELLRCPVSGNSLELQVIAAGKKQFDGKETEIIREGILFSGEDWFYPIIDGIPRLIVEAFVDYEKFFLKTLPDYKNRKLNLLNKYHDLLQAVMKKNRRTKQSFELEWRVFNYEKDKTWEADAEGMLKRFLTETAETLQNIKGKSILDAGCGNGLLDELAGGAGSNVIAIDISRSVERAYQKNSSGNVFFMQADIGFPPFAKNAFDIVHSSGVLHHTGNTEASFAILNDYLKPGGKMSIWLYHPVNKPGHRYFNSGRKIISKLPVKLQYYLILLTALPVAYLVKRLKGNRQNRREMFIGLLDWLTPEFRHEHSSNEASAWFNKRNYRSVTVTTEDNFGYNIIGIKEPVQ